MGWDVESFTSEEDQNDESRSDGHNTRLKVPNDYIFKVFSPPTPYTDDGSWWLAGGFEYPSPLSSTVFYDPAGFTRPGTPMPYAAREHCAARVNSTHALVVGGVDGDGVVRADAHLAELTEDGVWTPVPAMGAAR